MKSIIPSAVLAAALLACLGGWQPAAAAGDRHADYYYPSVTSSETYRARAQTLPEADRDLRLGFVIAQASEQAKRPYPPRFSMFAKGDDAQKLIIVGLHEDSFATLYRARGILAELTSQARSTSLFRNLAVEDVFTFFDLAKMLGFKRITVSDGDTYARQIIIE